MDKKINEMTEEEILRQQLELLAEKSKHETAVNIALLSDSMANIYKQLHP